MNPEFGPIYNNYSHWRSSSTPRISDNNDRYIGERSIETNKYFRKGIQLGFDGEMEIRYSNKTKPIDFGECLSINKDGDLHVSKRIRDEDGNDTGCSNSRVYKLYDRVERY